jgi:hypothetical protein
MKAALSFETSLATRRNFPTNFNFQQRSYGETQTSRAFFTTAAVAFKWWCTPSFSYRILFCEKCLFAGI